MLDYVDIVDSNFVYQMNNACYKSYTLESVQKYQMNPIIKHFNVVMKVRKMQGHVVGDWGALIVKISIFFVDKEKTTWKNKYAKAVNTLNTNNFHNFSWSSKKYIFGFIGCSCVPLTILSFRIIFSHFQI